MSFDISKLSDKELKEKLTDLGHGSGRITATTRQVYENLLEKLMGAATGKQVGGGFNLKISNDTHFFGKSKLKFSKFLEIFRYF